MDIENIKSWVSQPDVCRCCLSASGTWDVTASYLSDSAIKEVYFEMLRDCFGITLSYVQEWGPSRMVCQLCAGHLRGARLFRDQVLQAERHFTDYWANRDSIAPVEIKIEKLDAVSPCADDDAAAHSNDDENQSLCIIKSEKENKTKRKKQKGERARRKKKRTETADDVDSDAPIAAMIEKVPSADDDKDDIALNKQIDVAPPIKGRLVSERARAAATAHALLRATTACPFRHHNSWFRCFYCPRDFMRINRLRDHTLRDHSDVENELKKLKRYPRSLQIEISNLECRSCQTPLTDVEDMRRHLGEVHQKVIYKECIADYKVDASPYTCHLCDREFHVFRTLTTHLNEHYANCICDVCGKSFLNSKRLKVHKRTHESGSFPCSECGKVLKTKTSKANHMESAHSKRQIRCQICFEPMKHYTDRIKHMSEVHNITHTFKCPICGREYNIKHYLATHIRQTHGHKNKKCTECGMAFVTNHGLKKHMLKHSGEKPFTCTICSKSYARNYTLREHMRAHENHSEKTLLCQE